MVGPVWARIGHDQARCGAGTGAEDLSTRQRKTADANPVITDNNHGASGKVVTDRWEIGLDDLELVRRSAAGKSPGSAEPKD